MSEIRNLPRDLASGVSEVVRKRLGKTENVLTAEGAAGVQSLVEIDRDYEEATQYIHAADAEILDKGGPVDLAITRCWQAFLLVQKH